MSSSRLPPQGLVLGLLCVVVWESPGRATVHFPPCHAAD